jgi:hypothetical protein
MSNSAAKVLFRTTCAFFRLILVRKSRLFPEERGCRSTWLDRLGWIGLEKRQKNASISQRLRAGLNQTIGKNG